MPLTELGFAAALFYGLIYLLVAFAVFVVACGVGRSANPTMDDLAGLYTRAPLLGVLLLAGLFGLAGVTPTPGFAGKWFLFSAAMESGFFWLVLIGAVNATISLYCYLRVVRAAYQTVEPEESLPPLRVSPTYQLASYLTLALIGCTGIYPGPLWDLCQGAARAALGT